MSRLPVRLVGVLGAVLLLASACGGSDAPSSAPEIDLTQPLATSTPTPAAPDDDQSGEPTGDAAATPEPTATPAPEPTATPTPEPTPTPAPERVFWHDVIGVGQCFDRTPLAEGELPTPIPCDDLHEEEIYASVELDIGQGAPYPGDDQMFEIANAQVCDDATLEFAGAAWSDLPFVTYALFPTEEEWDAGDRHVMCSAGGLEVDTRKIGTAAGGTLDSADTLLVRTAQNHPSVGDFDDWVLIREHAPVEQAVSLTAGQFDLPLRRAGLLSGAFMFYASGVGEPEIPNQLWSIEWDELDPDMIDTPVPEFQYASPVNQARSFVFAAREATDADWNLFALGDDGASVLGDEPTDEQYPALTPDGQRVVFQRDGDLWITDIDGTNQAQLTDTDADEWESSISPDGRWIAFASNRSGNDDIWLMSIDGGDAVNLTNHPGDEFWPSWSRDGSTIYFASDRLSPEEDRGVIMMMNADGSDASWFGTFSANQPVPVSPADAETARATFPTLDERYNETVPIGAAIEGEPGTLTTWTHSTERLQADLPAGWFVVEQQQGLASVLAGVDPAEAERIWESDAIYITLYESPSIEDFVADHFDTALANTSCDARDELELTEADGGLWVVGRESTCGDGTGRVAAFYRESTGLGIVVEAQSDDLPTFDEDDVLLGDILETIQWR